MIQFNHKIKLAISANPIILNINLAIVFIIILGHKILHEQLVGSKAKGESQNGGNKNTKHAKFSEKYVYVSEGKIRTCAYQGVKNVRFSENLARFVFLLPPFWDSSFCHITDELIVINISLSLVPI